MSTHNEKVLVVLPTWVGDVAMATPMLRAIANHYGEQQVAFLMYHHLEPIVSGNPWLKTTYFWPPKQAESPTYKRWLNTLRAQHFDIAILLPNSLRVAWFAWRIGAKRRVGYARDGRSPLLTDALPAPNRRSGRFDPLPLVDYYAHLAGYLGIPAPGDALTLHTNPSDTARLAQRLQQADVPAEKPLVTLCPGAQFGASKCWHTDRFAEVADALARHHDVAIVISPGPGEEPLAHEIAGFMQEPYLLLDEPCLSLGELKSLIQRSVLLLGNDTGPRHFARAFDTPRVTIFGPTEQRWTETSHNKETIVKVSVPCGPCHQKVCPEKERICMDRIQAKTVYDACIPYVS